MKVKYVVNRYHHCEGIFTFNELKKYLLNRPELSEYTDRIKSATIALNRSKSFTYNRNHPSLEDIVYISDFAVIKRLNDKGM